jgi:DNA uptake protein ComE-like DNA-binding protein
MRFKRLFLPVGVLLVPALGLACAGGDAESADAQDATDEAAAIAAASAAEEAAATEEAMLSPNEASSEELAAIAGMTDAAVAALMGGRPFTSMVDVHAVLVGTIGEEAALAAYASLWMPISLNDASREEILLIPGVGDRMAHEFEEYRPYSDMDQFRREMGKYVDEEEVARLERYVTLN